MPNNKENIALIQTFFDAFNKHDLNQAMSYVADDALLNSLRGQNVKGKLAISRYIGGFLRERTTARAVLGGAMFATEDWGFVEWVLKGAGPEDIKGGHLFGFKDGEIIHFGCFIKGSS